MRLRLAPFAVAFLLLAAACETEPTHTPTADPAPNPVRNLTAMTIYDALAIELRWEHAPGPADTYVIERAEAESGPWEEIARVAATESTSYVDYGGESYVVGERLEDQCTYWYRIFTELADGTRSGPSAVASAMAVDLPRPTPTPTTCS